MRAEVPLDATISEEVIEKARTLRQPPSQTIRPSRHTPDTETRRAISALTSRSADGGVGVTIELEDTLGEGGMGIVHLATQVALGRKVAVKALRKEIRDEGAVAKLLREAWITGSLEHPNVVPVYDVGLDEDQRPLIVLKRIEGTQWEALMRAPERVEERFGAKDLLEWNLRIFVQVCDAVRFAHSRGIVHRDLKPENVMIGGFGEVYVLDWGIAVSLFDDGTGRLPLAAEATEMAGTPHYMAPEMLGGPEPGISERTDVYLLGAVLFEVATGEPPHDGENFMAVVASVASSEPVVPEGVPPELAGIIRRAMAREPADRHADAEQLRAAVRGFLDHRGSALLAARAERSAAHLLDSIDRADRQDESHRRHLYSLFSECRFGFREALAAWPDNVPAREGLRDASVAMIEHELSIDDPRAADALAAELAEVPPDLVARIEEAHRRKHAERRETESFAARGRQEDQRIGRRTRAFLAGVLGSLWVAETLTCGFAGPRFVSSYVHTLLWPVAVLGVSVAVGYWARESLLATAFNRRICVAVVVSIVGELVVSVGSLLLGVDAAAAQVYTMMVWAAVASVTVLTLDLRLLPIPAAFVAAFLYSSIWPQHRFFAMSASQVVLMANAVWLWRRPSPDESPLVETYETRRG